MRHNQLELTSELQDFADTQKYIKIIQEINKRMERERLEQIQEMCNRVVWLDEHKVRMVGEASQVCQAYREYWN